MSYSILNNTVHKNNMKVMGEMNSSSSKEIFEIKCGDVETMLLTDTGATVDGCTATLLNELIRRGQKVVIGKLKEPISVEMANGELERVTRVVSIPRMDMVMSTKANENIKIYEHIFYVIEGDGEFDPQEVGIILGSRFMYHVWGVDMQEIIAKSAESQVHMQQHMLHERFSDVTWVVKDTEVSRPKQVAKPDGSNCNKERLHNLRNELRICGGTSALARFRLCGVQEVRKVQNRRVGRIDRRREPIEPSEKGVFRWERFESMVKERNDQAMNEAKMKAREEDTGPPPGYKPDPAKTRLTSRVPHFIRSMRYRQTVGGGGDLTINDILGVTRVKELQIRMFQRRIRLMRACRVTGIPFQDEKIQAILGTDALSRLEGEQIQQLMQPYMRDMEADESLDPDGEADEYDVLHKESSDRENVEKLLLENIKKACEAMGVYGDMRREFHNIVWKYKEVFGTNLDETWLEAARVTPLKVQLVPNAVPKKVRVRSYSKEAREFMQQTFQEMERHGMLYRNDDCVWASPVMVVPKPGKAGQFRLVVDLRWINRMTQPIQAGMPLIDEILEECKGAKYFFVIDLLKGFWQVLVDPSCQEYFSYMTPDGVYTPTRLQMGGTDSPLYFQAAMTSIFIELVREGKLQIWIDDILGHGKDWESFCGVLRRFLQLCEEKNLKLNVAKSVLGDCKAHWCGRDIDGVGVTHYARRTDDMLSVPIPQLAGELAQFAHCTKWMAQSIPRYSEIASPLWEILRKAEKQGEERLGHRRKVSYENISLKVLGWDSTHESAFKEIQKSLNYRMKNAHFDWSNTSQTVCLLTDASKSHYAALLTTVEKWEEGKPVHEQKHNLLRTFSGEFKGSQKNWSVIEKESFPIIESIKVWRDYLMRSCGFNLYCDHENIVTLFKPDSANPVLGKQALDKVYRWCYALCRFRINVMEHLPGQHNIWADMLSRWGHETYKQEVQMFSLRSQKYLDPKEEFLRARKELPRKASAGARGMAKSKPKKAFKKANKKRKFSEVREKEAVATPNIPGPKRKRMGVKALEKRRKNGKFTNNEFLALEFEVRQRNEELPGCQDILQAQRQLDASDKTFIEKNSTDMGKDINNVITYKGKVWIPASAKELQLHAMVMAHAGFQGHRGTADTLSKVTEWGYWEGVKEDVNVFLSGCRLCEKCKTSGDVVPRPWGQSLHGERPGQVLHFDFLYVQAPSEGWYHEYRYILVIKDDYSGLVDLIPCVTCDHKVIVEALRRWESLLGRAEWLVSDQGSHFNNKWMEAYVAESKVLYHVMSPNFEGVLASNEVETGDESTAVPQRHHFTMAYCPWANGTVENVNRHVLALIKIMTSEARVGLEQWPALLPNMAAALNDARSYRNHHHSPRELFMGQKSVNPLDVLYSAKTDTVRHVTFSSKEYDAKFQQLVESMEVIHKEVAGSRKGIWDRNFWGEIMAKRKANGSSVDHADRDRIVDFDVGDYVMVATPGKSKSKIIARWKGPFRVVEMVDKYVYRVQHLVTLEKSLAHVMRIKFFCSSELEVPVGLVDEIQSHENYDLEFDPECILDLKYDFDLQASYVKIKWRGFSEMETTWEFLDDFFETHPELCDDYFKSMQGLHHSQYDPRRLVH